MLAQANAFRIPLPDQSVKPMDLAYIAGLVDGEAYIGIKKDGSLTNGRLARGYHERIQIRMVDEEAIRFISETLGGNYYKEKPHATGGRPLYCYQANDLKAAEILNALQPYLKVKRRVAVRVLQLRLRKENPHKTAYRRNIKTRWGYEVPAIRHRLSEEELRLREQLYIECKAINSGRI